MKKATILLLLTSLLLTGCSTSTTTNQKSNNKETTTTKVQDKAEKNNETDNNSDATGNVSAEEMSKWTYTSGDNSVKVINNNQPTTIQATDFEQSTIYGLVNCEGISSSDYGVG